RAVRREVEVVGVDDRDRWAGLAGPRVDGGQGVAEVAVDVEGLHVGGGYHVLRPPRDREAPEDLVGGRVDHLDGVRLADGHVHPGWHAGNGGAEPARRRAGIDVE